jgi:Flp pilus assembly protein CpaB
MRARFRRLLAGPLPALPRPFDALSERWAALPPRARLATALTLVAVTAAAFHLYVTRVDARWGGAPVDVLVAVEDLPVGAAPQPLRRVPYPPAAVPPGAVTAAPEGSALALGLPAGSVLTDAHLDPRGPAAGLDPALRALPVPVEDGWGIVPGGWVDVWVLAADDPATLIARSRPVLEVREDGRSATALVGLRADEVESATAGLAMGRVLLAHAPPP